MLEKPDISDEQLLVRLRADYGLAITDLTFLPLGFDLNAAVFRAVAGDAAAYFVKLRRGVFDPNSVVLPRFLSDRGIRQIIAPIPTRSGRLWSRASGFELIVYPFVEGRTGREVRLSERQWIDFGVALKRLHTAPIPAAITQSLPQWTYASKWRDSVKTFVAKVRDETFVEPIAVRLADLLRARRDEILDLVERADALAGTVQRRAPARVVCHSDVHGSNLLIGADDALYIVDWDNPILAPKERDLMFAGGGQGFVGYSAEEEEALFYRGYGRTTVDTDALTYSRFERIIEDIALACDQLLSSAAGGADRELTLHYLDANFLPNGTIDVARRADARMKKRAK